MILADTSVWIEHFRRGEPALEAALDANEVMLHPFVIGELACGNLRDRAGVLAWLTDLSLVQEATHDEVMTFIERRRLMGRGIGYVDAHLLASTALTRPVRLFTLDRRLNTVATDLGLA